MKEERPTPLVEDLDGTRTKLEGWFSERRDTTITITGLDIPEGTGMSNVTLLFDIHWQQDGRNHSQSCVARLQPEIERPVFPSYDLIEQYHVMEAVGRHSDIPVPTLLGLETDPGLLGVQFYIMEYTAGRIPSDMPPYNMDGWMMHETSEAQREVMWRSAVDVMSRYHKLDHKVLGYEAIAEGDTPLQQQLAYWLEYHDWAMEGTHHEIGAAALHWLQANKPENEPTVLCWGDSRIGNIIFSENLENVAAVLDWEMAVMGNPVQDIAWFNFIDSAFAEGLGAPRLPGLPSYEDTVAQWQQASGHSARDYDYYVVFAAMRYGLILSRIMLATDQADQVQENFASLLLKKHLQRVGALSSM